MTNEDMERLQKLATAATAAFNPTGRTLAQMAEQATRTMAALVGPFDRASLTATAIAALTGRK